MCVCVREREREKERESESLRGVMAKMLNCDLEISYGLDQTKPYIYGRE